MSGSTEDDFDRFVRAHGPRLLRAAWLLTTEWAGAEDLVQTALERLWPKWSRLPDDDAQRLAYVHRIVTTSYLRGARRKWTGEVSHDVLPERAHAGSEAVAVEERHAVALALDRLPRRQRAVVVLRYLLDLSEADVARALHVSPGTVKSTTSRGLAALRADPRVAQLLDRPDLLPELEAPR